MKFEQGDRIEATNSVTGSKRQGSVIRSRQFRDHHGTIIEDELLTVLWDDRTVDHSYMTEGVVKVER